MFYVYLLVALRFLSLFCGFKAVPELWLSYQSLIGPKWSYTRRCCCCCCCASDWIRCSAINGTWITTFAIWRCAWRPLIKPAFNPFVRVGLRWASTLVTHGERFAAAPGRSVRATLSVASWVWATPTWPHRTHSMAIVRPLHGAWWVPAVAAQRKNSRNAIESQVIRPSAVPQIVMWVLWLVLVNHPILKSVCVTLRWVHSWHKCRWRS